ncbi:endogenous retrovirus group PABLB member 1 Env polyprotein-like [Lissotriton helveticus]
MESSLSELSKREGMLAQRSALHKMFHTKWFFSQVIILFLTISMLLVGGVYYGSQFLLSSATPTLPSHDLYFVSTVSPHSFYLLPQHEQVRRAEFRNNSFIQLLHQHQLVVNTTNCWVCGLMPHTMDKGIPYLVLPYSAQGSARALQTMFRSALDSYPHREPRSANSGPGPYHKTLARAIADLDRDIFDASLIPEEEERAYKELSEAEYSLSVGERQLKSSSPIWIVPHLGNFCLKGLGRNPRAQFGESACTETYVLPTLSSPVFLPAKGTYFVCYDRAYTWLPHDFSGTCYIANLLPPTFTVASDYHRTRIVRGVVSKEDTPGQEAGDFFKGFLPFWGPMVNSRNLRQLTRVVESTANITANALGNLTAELQADRLMTLQNRMVLDIVLADRGGVCKIIHSSCCVFIPDNAPTIYQAISKLHKISESIHVDEGNWTLLGWFWGLMSTWGWKILMIIGVVVTFLFSCCLCVQCGPALCGLCATTCIRQPVVTKEALKDRIMYQQHLNDLMSIEIDYDSD